MTLTRWLKNKLSIPEIENLPFQPEQVDRFISTAKNLESGISISDKTLVWFIRQACMHYLNRTYHKRHHCRIRMAVKQVVNTINMEQ